MSNKELKIQYELRNLRLNYGALQEIPCSKEQNKEYAELLRRDQPLPDGVYCYKNIVDEDSEEFYTVTPGGLTEQEQAEYLTYKKLSYLNTVKNCAVFFAILAIINIALSLIALLN